MSNMTERNIMPCLNPWEKGGMAKMVLFAFPSNDLNLVSLLQLGKVNILQNWIYFKNGIFFPVPCPVPIWKTRLRITVNKRKGKIASIVPLHQHPPIAFWVTLR